MNKKSGKQLNGGNGDECAISDQSEAKPKTESSTNQEAVHKTKLAELTNNEFDKQLEQINELEDKINKKSPLKQL